MSTEEIPPLISGIYDKIFKMIDFFYTHKGGVDHQIIGISIDGDDVSRFNVLHVSAEMKGV